MGLNWVILSGLCTFEIRTNKVLLRLRSNGIPFKLLHKLTNRLTYNISKSLKEARLKTIQPKILKQFHTENCFLISSFDAPRRRLLNSEVPKDGKNAYNKENL